MHPIKSPMHMICPHSSIIIYIGNMRRRKDNSMSREYVKWNKHPSLLVMSNTGGMGRAASTLYKRLTSMISKKRNKHETRN